MYNKYYASVPTIAHRGYHELEVENTYEAFIEAGKRSFYGIETDIYLTTDNVWICHHNSRVDDMDKDIIECSSSELFAMNLSKDPSKIARVPTLIQYLDVCKNYSKHPFIELKMVPSTDKLIELTDLIKERGMIDQVTFISFIPLAVTSLREICANKGYKTQFSLLVGGGENINDAIAINMSVDAYYPMINKDIIEQYHARNLKVIAWTVDDNSICQNLIDIGIDYITSDIIECESTLIDNNLY